MNTESKGIIIAFLAMITGSIVPILSKIVLSYFSSSATLFLRTSLACLSFAGFIFLSSKHKFSLSKKSLFVAMFGALNFTFFILGINLMQTVFTPVFYSMVPILTSIFAYILFKDKIQKTKFIGVIIGLIGALIIFSQSLSFSVESGIELAGFIFLVLASISITIYGLLIAKTKNLPPASSVSFQAIMLAAIFSIPLVAFIPDSLVVLRDLDARFWLGLFGLSVFATIFQYFLYQRGIELIGKTATVIMFYLQPVFVVLISSVFLTETISWSTYIPGMILILIGSSLNMELVLEFLRTRLSLAKYL